MCSRRFSKSLASLAETADGLQTVELRTMVGAEYDAERPGIAAGPFLSFLGAQWLGLEVHTTHAAARRHGGAGGGLLRQLGDHGLGGDQERRN
jgi:hypothetical protein